MGCASIATTPLTVFLGHLPGLGRAFFCPQAGSDGIFSSRFRVLYLGSIERKELFMASLLGVLATAVLAAIAIASANREPRRVPVKVKPQPKSNR